MKRQEKIREFLNCLAINNTVFPKRKMVCVRTMSLLSSSVLCSFREETSSLARISLIREYLLLFRWILLHPMKRCESLALMLTLSSGWFNSTQALSYFAQYMGVELFERSGGNIRLRIKEPGRDPYFEDYQHIAMIDFTSKRKKMSVRVTAANIVLDC